MAHYDTDPAMDARTPWTEWREKRVELRIMKDGSEWAVWGPLKNYDKLGVWIDQIVGHEDEVKRTFYPWQHVVNIRLAAEGRLTVTGWNAR